MHTSLYFFNVSEDLSNGLLVFAAWRPCTVYPVDNINPSLFAGLSLRIGIVQELAVLFAIGLQSPPFGVLIAVDS